MQFHEENIVHIGTLLWEIHVGRKKEEKNMVSLVIMGLEKKYD